MRRSPSMVWIFSFADLAFLLVLALVIIPTDNNNYADLTLASVVDSKRLDKSIKAEKLWRVYVNDEGQEYEAISVQKKNSRKNIWEEVPFKKSREGLLDVLLQLKAKHDPWVFAAHSKSESGNMLLALSIVQKVWPDRELVTPVGIDK